MTAELLAPAGSYESMKAAYAAGADAVYIGGTRFGARAYADNPDEEGLLRAIDHAHLKQKKLYLTVNTLFKESEMEELLLFLRPYYEAGLDAVIVQDLGAMRQIRRYFPELELHASTQMTITGAYGAAFLKEMGASRIVTSRELSLQEIRKIHESVDIEIESFVHGALCYCYSGQCLMSSMIGGRSGNRGRCAQPCRLPYDLYDEKRMLNKKEERYLLSPKDICTLELIPELIESGISSFKIEGRMKRAEYTAGVVRIYRKYLDRYLENGKAGYKIDPDDRNDLMDLYNRGGFSNGYYVQKNGPSMMSSARPNHFGTKGAKVLGISGQKLRLTALEMLHTGDVLQFRKENEEREFTLSKDVKKGQEFSLQIKGNIKEIAKEKHTVLFRTKNEFLLQKLADAYLKEDPEKIKGKLILSKGTSAILTVSFQDVEVTVTGAVPEMAGNRPLTKETVEKQMRKTGGTGFVFSDLETEMENDLFLPMQALNELRRNGIAALEEAFYKKVRRGEVLSKPKDACEIKKEQPLKESWTPDICVSLERADSLPVILAAPEVKRVYLDSAVFDGKEDFLAHSADYIRMCHESDTECYYAMPLIFRDRAERFFDSREVMEALSRYDGILIKTMEEYQFLKEKGYKGPVAADACVYTWNREAVSFWNEKGIAFDTAPVELHEKELRMRGCEHSELIVYGYLPLMVSAQCQTKNLTGCSHKPGILYLKDRKRKCFAVQNRCDFCYNVIYNSTPLELIENREDLKALHPAGIRLCFTTEDIKEQQMILKDYVDVFLNGKKSSRQLIDYTRGHFKRGVE